MLYFFRKNQKFFFSVTAVIAIISFVFLGVFDRSQMGTSVYEDKTIGKLINGKSLNEIDLKQFSLFINSSKSTVSIDRSFTNVFNDGVVTNDFLKTKLAHLLVKKYFTKLKPEMEDRLEKIKNYTPYAHPEAPFLSAKAMWQHFSPKIAENIEKLALKQEVDEEFFTLLVELYLAQLEFPGEYLKRVLSYHQGQYSWLQPDPRLYDEDFSLFGFHSLFDWFGPSFIDMVSQFVLNTAAYSEQKGFFVSKQEAKEKMLYNLATIDVKEGLEYRSSLQFLGFKERDAIRIWQKILLFRRVFDDLTKTVLLDSFTFDTFSSFALEKATLDIYQMQKPFQFSEFTDLLKFQVYLENISVVSRKDLLLPDRLFSIEEVEEKAPDLMKRVYKVNLAKFDLNERAVKISLAKMQEWQLEDKNWALLADKFSDCKMLEDREKRYEALETLDSKKRKEIDEYSRKQLLLDDPNYVSNALNEQEKETMTIEIYSNGQTNASWIADGEQFSNFLENPKGVYQQDEQYFSVEVFSKEKNILTFKEAVANGVLDRMLETMLEEEYDRIKLTSAQNFKDENGDFKPLSQVTSLVGVYLFSDLLKAIDIDYQQEHNNISWLAGMGQKDFYCKYRFYKHLRECKSEILNKEFVHCLELPSSDFKDQWKVVKNSIEVKKADQSDFSNGVFEKEFVGLSPIVPVDETLCFFEVKEKSIDKEAQERQKENVKKELTLSMKEELAQKLLLEIEDKSAMVFIASLSDTENESS